MIMTEKEEGQQAAVVKKEPSAVTAPPVSYGELDGFTGYEDMATALVIPRMKIVQPTSREGDPGHFRMNLTGEESTSIKALAIKAEIGRVMWPDKFDSDSVPDCRSFDGFTPDPGIESPGNSICQELQVLPGGREVPRPVCPFAAWGQDDERPRCDEIFNFLCINLNDNLPFWMTISGASISNFKKYISSIALRRKKLFEFSTVLSLKEEIGQKGRYYVLQFSPATLISIDADILARVTAFRHETAKRAVEAEENATSESEIPGVTAPAWMNEKGVD